jgi:hypothetical protein
MAWWNILDRLRDIRRPAPDPERPIAAADPVRADEDHAEYGFSGNESYAGEAFIADDEYNPVLKWPLLASVVDEMRKSSPDAIAMLRMLKLPILRATYEIRPPENGTTEDKAIADFCTWALLRTNAMRDPWPRALRHFLLMLEFGFSAAELVWNVAMFDRRPVYNLWRLAPRLPKTLKGWIVSRYGELEYMVQHPPTLRPGDRDEKRIPADYLCVTCNEREGDNYNGLSVLRAAYKPWYYQNQLEHIDMIRHHRFSAGIPEAKVTGPTKLTRTERNITEDTLRSIASSEASYLITPASLEFKIHHPPPGDSGVVKSMEYHKEAIPRSILAMFLNRQSEGLNTNRTRVLSDLFGYLLEAFADELAADINKQVIVRLCDQNFTMTGREYPSGRFTNINPLEMKELATMFKELGAGFFLTPDDDLEGWMRRMVGAPELPKAFARGERPQPVAQPENTPTARPGSQPADDDTRDEGRIAARDPIEIHGRQYSREPTELERRIVALAEVPDKLDTVTEAITKELIDLRKRQLAKAAAFLANRDTLPSPESIPMAEAGDAYAIIRQMQEDLDAFGAQQVRHELLRQGAPAVLFARDRAGDLRLGRQKKDLNNALVASARSFADWLTTEWRSDILDAAVRLRRTDVNGDELERQLITELNERAEQGVLRFTKQKVNEAYGIGRAKEAEAHSDVIARVVQSCLLDRNSCKPCIAVDGEEMRFGSQRQRSLAPPYRHCAGKENCRCAQLYVYENPRDRAGEGVRLRDEPGNGHQAPLAITLRDGRTTRTPFVPTITIIDRDPMTGIMTGFTKRELVEDRPDDH